jgi:hypothetical protein
MEFDTAIGTVRIRDLSANGALLEGDALPPVGAAFVLKRQALQVRGTVVWNAGARCGVRFEGIISVPDWVAGHGSGTGPARGQARVDDIQAAVRAGMTPAHPAAPGAAGDVHDLEGLDQRIAAELAYVRRLLDTAGEAFIDEPVLLRRHGPALQAFDIAGQILGHLGAILAADDRAAAIDAVGMQDLRARLSRRRLFTS